MRRRQGQTVAVIPARGGSKRIPRKNLAKLGGHPLIAHTIFAALRATKVDAVYVTTEDKEIAAVARRYGAKVIWRPEDLASATAPTEPCLQHALEDIEKQSKKGVDRLVMLQPTSPFRGSERIDQALELMDESSCDSVVGVFADVRYYFLGDIDEESRLTVGYDPDNRLRTQDIKPRYQETGALYVMTREQLMDRGCRMGGDMRALVLDETESMDIDTVLDLRHCEFLLQAGVAQGLSLKTAA
jgi:CMP-N,N'-diacetyllegionaminic acid synthase